MSWIGQSLAAHRISHRPGEGGDVAPGDDLLAGGHGVRSDEADHVHVRARQGGDEQPDVDVRLEPERVPDGLGEHPPSLPRRRAGSERPTRSGARSTPVPRLAPNTQGGSRFFGDFAPAQREEPSEEPGCTPRGRTGAEELERRQGHGVDEDRQAEAHVEQEAEQPVVELQVHEEADDDDELGDHHHDEAEQEDPADVEVGEGDLAGGDQAPGSAAMMMYCLSVAPCW